MQGFGIYKAKAKKKKKKERKKKKKKKGRKEGRKEERKKERKKERKEHIFPGFAKSRNQFWQLFGNELKCLRVGINMFGSSGGGAPGP
jgi:sRNA-binding protein